MGSRQPLDDIKLLQKKMQVASKGNRKAVLLFGDESNNCLFLNVGLPTYFTNSSDGILFEINRFIKNFSSSEPIRVFVFLREGLNQNDENWTDWVKDLHGTSDWTFISSIKDTYSLAYIDTE